VPLLLLLYQTFGILLEKPATDQLLYQLFLALDLLPISALELTQSQSLLMEITRVATQQLLPKRKKTSAMLPVRLLKQKLKKKLNLLLLLLLKRLLMTELPSKLESIRSALKVTVKLLAIKMSSMPLLSSLLTM
jgi:hypothetical protein